MRKILVGMLAVLLLLVFPGIASAQEVPKIDFWPKTGISGSSLSVQGSGFTSNTFVRIFLGEEQVTIAPADMSGNFWASFTVKEEGKVVARDNAGREAVAKEEFRLIPQALIEPSRTIANRLVKIRGTGFPKNKELLIYFEGKKVSSVFLSERRDFEIEFGVPAVSGGSKFVEIKGGDLTTLAKADFYVEPQTISVYPSQGRIGSLFEITGAGFPANSSLGIQFADKGRSVPTDRNGYFKTTFSVPPLEPGRYGVEVSAGPIRVLSLFEILPPTLSISSFQVKAGERITLRVEGAIPFSPVAIHLDGNEIRPVSNAMIGPDGTLKVEAIIPPLAPGDYYLRVFKGTKSEVGQIINLLPEPPGKIERVLAPISQHLVRVWGWEAGRWKLYDPTLPSEFNELKELERGKAYFVQVKENCQLISGSFLYKLYKGWNLIGWIE